MKSRLYLLGITLVLCLVMSGCGQKTVEQKVVAKINNYQMTIADLKEEMTHSPYGRSGRDLDDLLDLAIRRQVLIQEAQRRGLDKKETFMKTIERYWEQTLIKELIDQETRNVSKSKSREEQERALDDWVNQLQNKADIKIYKSTLKVLDQ